ncbi:hypothetical protein NDU88_005614 [Pleurodeles waltl]|uniref:Uncharacterized protein n=1 Tax=Pleurodeles waltl TaxID=8319 RepID=A0AAV7WCF0_PLEWA|nr:hypothetical protein NDU88_005614 [Pleurodeles waltl]
MLGSFPFLVRERRGKAAKIGAASELPSEVRSTAKEGFFGQTKDAMEEEHSKVGRDLRSIIHSAKEVMARDRKEYVMRHLLEGLEEGPSMQQTMKPPTRLGEDIHSISLDQQTGEE